MLACLNAIIKMILAVHSLRMFSLLRWVAAGVCMIASEAG